MSWGEENIQIVSKIRPSLCFLSWVEETWIRIRIGVSGSPQQLCGNIYATPHIFVYFPGLWGGINNKQLQLPSEKLNFAVAALNIYPFCWLIQCVPNIIASLSVLTSPTFSVS